MRFKDDPDFEIISKKFTNFLEIRKWNYFGKIPDLAFIWKKSFDKKNREIVIPVSAQVDDWFSAFRAALKILCDTELLNFSEIGAYLLTNSKSDEIISVRAYGSLCINNSLPLKYGLGVHEGLGELVLCGAKEYFKKMQVGIPKKEQDKNLISAYISGIKLIQSSIGSYIVNVELPVAVDGVESESYTGITKNVKDAIANIVVISEQEKILNIDKIVVNTRICDALLNFGGIEEDQEVEIIFKKYSPLSMNGFIQENIKLEKEIFPKIRRLSAYCKDNNLPIKKSVFGFITRLDREIGDRSGIIFVKCRVNSKEIKLRIKLESEDYRNAINAHDAELPVSFSCEVLNVGRRWFGDNVEKFSVAGNKNLDI